jgi:hypothetical protein
MTNEALIAKGVESLNRLIVESSSLAVALNPIQRFNEFIIPASSFVIK